MFTDDTCKLEDLCGPNDKIYAIVPSPQTANVSAALAPLIPASLSRPIHDHVENCKTDLEPPVEKENKRLADLEAKWEAKWEEERKREKAEREEERKREKAEREEERKREKAEREEERKREKAEREEERKREEAKWEAKREDERKREEAKWEVKREEERRREQLERAAEKAEADKKYEDLRQHLLEVEETTMDTVGWIAHNVCHHFSIFI
jgi:hypothetical protein